IRDSEVIMKYHELFQMFCPSFKGFSGGLESRKICEFFENQYEIKRVANHLVFNKESFINRARSASYSLIEGDEKFEDYMEALEKFFEKYAVDGFLTMPNETVWYVGEV
ncbi:class I SAM-dependent methyltransferase, partial [Turicibacter sanguinis]|nr:class I SAM-dependent methyltransferase [Turicibacter sanguinis]